MAYIVAYTEPFVTGVAESPIGILTGNPSAQGPESYTMHLSYVRADRNPGPCNTRTGPNPKP